MDRAAYCPGCLNLVVVMSREGNDPPCNMSYTHQPWHQSAEVICKGKPEARASALHRASLGRVKSPATREPSNTQRIEAREHVLFRAWVAWICAWSPFQAFAFARQQDKSCQPPTLIYHTKDAHQDLLSPSQATPTLVNQRKTRSTRIPTSETGYSSAADKLPFLHPDDRIFDRDSTTPHLTHLFIPTQGKISIFSCNLRVRIVISCFAQDLILHSFQLIQVRYFFSNAAAVFAAWACISRMCRLSAGKWALRVPDCIVNLIAPCLG